VLLSALWRLLLAVGTAEAPSTGTRRTAPGSGAISLGWRADGKRIRRKVTGRTKTEVREKLKQVKAEAEAGLKTSASYPLSKAVDDWAAEALGGLTDKTVRSHVDLLRPVMMLIGNVPLRDLTAHDVRQALSRWPKPGRPGPSPARTTCWCGRSGTLRSTITSSGTWRRL
jgi:hypothetical protein